jgi:hypothetical protein
MRTSLAVALALALAHSGALAHGGGLNAKGCHNNRKTGDYHCHRAPPVAPPVQRFAPEEQRAQQLPPSAGRPQGGADVSLAERERALIERERLLIERERALVGGRPTVPATQALVPQESSRRGGGPTCHVGPRGGTYTITASGRKNYGGC